jgi:hypothetical protein
MWRCLDTLSENGTERTKDFMLIVASRRVCVCEAGASRGGRKVAADQFPVARVRSRSDDSTTVAEISSRYEGFRGLLMKRKKTRK